MRPHLTSRFGWATAFIAAALLGVLSCGSRGSPDGGRTRTDPDDFRRPRSSDHRRECPHPSAAHGHPVHHRSGRQSGPSTVTVSACASADRSSSIPRSGELQRSLWDIPDDIGWELYIMDRPTVPGTIQVRVLLLDQETPLIHTTWNPQEPGPFSMGFSTEDLDAWDPELRGQGLRVAHAPVPVPDSPSRRDAPTGSTRRSSTRPTSCTR